MYHQYREGWIEVISGCMFAGKTEELIRRINVLSLSLIHISEPTRQAEISYAVFCLKKKKKKKTNKKKK